MLYDRFKANVKVFGPRIDRAFDTSSGEIRKESEIRTLHEIPSRFAEWTREYKSNCSKMHGTIRILDLEDMLWVYKWRFG